MNHGKPITELSDLSGIDLSGAANAVMRRRQRDIEVLREGIKSLTLRPSSRISAAYWM
jgi:hypothetical protein